MEDPPLTPEVMTVFAWLMMAREQGRRIFEPQIAEETELSPSAVATVTSMLVQSRWLKARADGYEVTPDGGIAFYALVSGVLPPAAGEI